MTYLTGCLRDSSVGLLYTHLQVRLAFGTYRLYVRTSRTALVNFGILAWILVPPSSVATLACACGMAMGMGPNGWEARSKGQGQAQGARA